MTTLQRLQLSDAVNGILAWLVGKNEVHDPFDPLQEEIALRAAMYDAWDAGVKEAAQAMHVPFGTPTSAMVAPIVASLKAHLSGPAITRRIATTATESIEKAFVKGKASTDATFKKQTGREPQVRKDANPFFGALFGLTEQHAMQAMMDQVMIAAGTFWDDQLQDSIKSEMESWFSGEITRDELTDKLSQMVNDRLATEGQSLARSYFDNLSTHIVNSSRNIGSFYRGQSLGATQYTLYNPHDKRTSAICRAVTQGQVYSMGHAMSTVTAKLQARTTEDLKASVPFLTPETAASATGPVPPLHWPKCRTLAEMVFEGL